MAREDIERGQEVFLKYGLMEHGTLWGHGAYLGPDYSAEYLHRTVQVGRDTLARAEYGECFESLSESQQLEIGEALKRELKQNRYAPSTGTLRFTAVEAASFEVQGAEWRYKAGTFEVVRRIGSAPSQAAASAMPLAKISRSMDDDSRNSIQTSGIAVDCR